MRMKNPGMLWSMHGAQGVVSGICIYEQVDLRKKWSYVISLVQQALVEAIRVSFKRGWVLIDASVLILKLEKSKKGKNLSMYFFIL